MDERASARAYEVLEISAWDEGAPLLPEYLLAGDPYRLGPWRDKLLATWEDICLVWSQRNVQGMGVVLRALAEHVGLGSLCLASTYRAIETGSIPSVVLGPAGQDRLIWSRRRVRSLLTGMTQDPYDGLTVLEGFAHPSRFSMQVYMDRSLFGSGTVNVGRHNNPAPATYLGLVAQRLVIVSAVLAADAGNHVT